MKKQHVFTLVFRTFCLMTFSFNVTLAAIVTPAVDITGDHYVSARSMEQSIGTIVISNKSGDALVSINAATNSTNLHINNPCSAGVLPNQSCKITYTFTAGDDVGAKHNLVSSQLESIKLSYQQGLHVHSNEFYVVTEHVDTRRLLTLPVSSTAYHKIASSQTNDLTYDEITQTIYLSTENGLSISDDGGSHWQTLTPFNSNLNDHDEKIKIGNVAPQFTYIDKGILYVALSNQPVTTEDLMRSNDHGASWTRLKHFNTVPINSMVADGNNIYVANYGLYISHDAGKTWQVKFANKQINAVSLNSTGLYIGTKDGISFSNDGGNIFHTLLSTQDKPCSNNNCNIKKIKLVGDKIYGILSGNLGLGPNGSTNTQLIVGNKAGFQSILELGIDDRCDYSVKGNLIVAGCYADRTYVSRNGGQTWTPGPQYNGAALSAAAGNNIILMSDKDKTKIMLLSTYGTPLTSDDYGQNWTTISPSVFANVDIPQIAVNKSGNILLIDTLGSISADSTPLALSKDSGSTWQSVFSKQYALNLTSPFTFNDAFYYFSDSQLMRSNAAVNTWMPVGSNVQHGPKVVVGADGAFYSVPYFSKDLSKAIYVSHDAGISWQTFGPNIKPNSDYSACDLVVKPGSKTMLVSATCTGFSVSVQSSGLFIQTDKKTNLWKEVFPGLKFGDIDTIGTDIYVMTVPICLSCGLPAYLDISHDSGATWMKKTIRLPSRIPSQPHLLGVRKGKIYIAIPSGGITSDGFDTQVYTYLKVSSDDGNSWEDLGALLTPTQLLSSIPMINDFVFTDKQIYIATEVGLYSIGLA